MKILLLNVKLQLLPKQEIKDLLHPHKDLMPPQAEELEVKPHMQEGTGVLLGTEGSKA